MGETKASGQCGYANPLTCEPKRPPSPKRLLVNCVRVPEEDEETDSEKKVVVKKVEVDSSVKSTKYIIYGVTVVLLLVFLRFLYKLIKYLIRR